MVAYSAGYLADKLVATLVETKAGTRVAQKAGTRVDY